MNGNTKVLRKCLQLTVISCLDYNSEKSTCFIFHFFCSKSVKKSPETLTKQEITVLLLTSKHKS